MVDRYQQVISIPWRWLSTEWLTGEELFSGTTNEILWQQVNTSPPISRLSELGIPDAIGIVLRKALSKRPEDRFKGVLDFALALDQARNVEQEHRWSSLLLTLIKAFLSVMFSSIVLYSAGMGTNAVLLVGGVILLVVSLTGAIVQQNKFLLNVTIVSFIGAAIFGFVLASYVAFLLALLALFILAFLVGCVIRFTLLQSKQRKRSRAGYFN